MLYYIAGIQPRSKMQIFMIVWNIRLCCLYPRTVFVLPRTAGSSAGHSSSPHLWCVNAHWFPDWPTVGCSCRLAVFAYSRTLLHMQYCSRGPLQPAITKAKCHLTWTTAGESVIKRQLYNKRYWTSTILFWFVSVDKPPVWCWNLSMLIGGTISWWALSTDN